jgi:hypothetical protein
LAQYEQFRRKMDPAYSNAQSGGSGLQISWPSEGGAGNNNGGSIFNQAGGDDDDDDLYS